MQHGLKCGEKQELHTGDGELHGILKHADLFPNVSRAICIALSPSVTTCTAERPFSTLRRVKTWIRSTMQDERLSGLRMMSVHREKNMAKTNNALLKGWETALEEIPDVYNSCFEVTTASRAT